MKMKIGIRRRMMFTVLSTSLATLLILSGVVFYGMNGVRNLALQSAEEIGVQTALNANDALEEQKKNELISLASDKAEVINQHLATLAADVEKIAAEMTHINSHAFMFMPQTVPTPESVSLDDIAFYIQHAENFDRAAFEREIELTANIRDFLVRTVESNEMAESMLVASKHNFTLSADDNRRLLPKERTVIPTIYNAVNSDWYRRAAAEKQLIFTDVRRFAFMNMLGTFCAMPYFDSGGELAGVAGAEASLDRISTIVDEVSMHERGFCFIVDNLGRVILSSDKSVYSEDNPSEIAVSFDYDLRLHDNPELVRIAVQMLEGIKGVREAAINGKQYYVAFAPIKQTNWSFAAAIEESVVTEPIIQSSELIKGLTKKRIAELDDHMMQTMMFMGVFIIVLLIATAYVGRRQSEHFVEPIHQLSDGVREISSGDLDKKLNIHTGDELESLAISFNAMTDELKKHMRNLKAATAEKERIATELDVAMNIQQSMLPNIFPPFPDRKEFDIYATMNAAREVGGDFYDFYMLDDDHLIITIADVSGKGVPAALFMVISKTILKNFVVSSIDDLANVMEFANQQLCQNNDEMMFVTVFMAQLDIRTGELIYVNGGHNPPLVRRKGNFEYLQLKKSCALGINELLTFRQYTLKLEAGDALFLYTDGVTEAIDVDDNQYSEERLLETLNKIPIEASVEEIIASVKRDLKAHVKGAEQSDDITMLAMKFNKH